MPRHRPDASALCSRHDLPAPPEVVIEALAPLLVDGRLARIEAVLGQRTRDVAVVLEAVDNPHNVSAVLRSADSFGVQEVHLVRGEAPFQVSKLVTQGADRWLDIIEHESGTAAVAALHRRGFRVYVATMDGDVSPRDLPSIDKVAIVFGNEKLGVSGEMAAACDGRYTIPMRGFSQSLNVSVAAAITLQAATTQRASRLDDTERTLLRARFMLLSVPHGREVVAEYLERRG